jgi:hypothetical protein
MCLPILCQLPFVSLGLCVQGNCRTSGATLFITLISSVKLAHPKQIRARKAAKIGLRFGDVSRQLIDNSISPFCAFNLAANGFSNLPVKIN